METQELHRGRLIDHIQLVVRDLPASQRFYAAIFEVLGIPMGGTGAGYFWADELFVSEPAMIAPPRSASRSTRAAAARADPAGSSRHARPCS